MAKLQTLQDEFNGSTLKTALWTQFTGGSATFTYASSGAQVNFPATTSSSTDGDDTSATTYTLIDSFALVNILAIPVNGATTSSGLLRLQITSANMVWWRFTSGNIQAVKTVASAATQLFTATWNATTHAWIRIRESNGTTYWEYSADSINWTIAWSEANPITLTALTVLLGGVSTGIDSSPGTFKWANFNCPKYGQRTVMNDYQFLKVGDGMSVSEKIR